MRAKSILLALLASACGRAAAPAAPPATATPAQDPREARWHADAEEFLGYLGGMTDRACACPDAACASTADAEVREHLAARLAKPDQFTPAEDTNFDASMGFTERLIPLLTRFMTCVRDLGAELTFFSPYVLRDVTEFRDRACACPDAMCARGVENDFLAWKEWPTDEATRERALAMMRETRACLAERLEGSGLSRAEQLVLELKTLRDRACACADQACFTAISEELRAIGEAQTLVPDPSAEQRMKESLDEIVACAKAFGAARAADELAP